MKKAILLLIVHGCFASASFSQVQLGLRGGLNVSNFVVNDISRGYALGSHGGLFMRFNSDKKFYFQPEALFSTKGSAYRGNLAGKKWVDRERLTYLDLPLMIGIKPMKNFSILLGVQPSVLLGALTISHYSNERIKHAFGVYSFRTFDFGLVGGIQMESKFGLDVGLRFSYGLSSIYNYNQPYKYHNINFMATIGYAINKLLK